MKVDILDMLQRPKGKLPNGTSDKSVQNNQECVNHKTTA